MGAPSEGHERAPSIPGLRGVGVVLVAMFIANAAAYAIAVPFFQAPDEPLHLATIRYVRERGSYPDARADRIQPGIMRALDDGHFHEMQPLETLFFEDGSLPPWRSFDERDTGAPGSIIAIAGHPPAYYYLMVPFEAAASRASIPVEVLLLRLVNVLIAAAAVWFAFATVRVLWPARLDMAIVAAAFVALVPQFAHISGSISNDPLMATLFAATLYLGARVAKEGLTRALAFASAPVLALGVLTKAQGIVALGVFAAACLVSLRTRREWMSAIAVFALPVLAGVAWYGVRLAKGLPVSPTDPAPGVANPQQVGIVTYTYRYVAPIVSRSFWGKFGWLAVRLPDAWYLALEALAGTGLVMSAVVVGRAARRRLGDAARWALGVAGAASTGLLLAVIVSTSLKTFRNTGEPRGLQGRYLFPVLGVIAVAVVGGWLTLWPARVRRVAGVGVIAVMTGASLAGLWSVVKWFYGGPGTPVGDLADRLGAYSGMPAAPVVVALLTVAVVGCAAFLAVKSFRAGEDVDSLVGIPL